MKFPSDIYKAREFYRRVKANPQTARFLNVDKERMSLVQKLFAHGRVTKHSQYYLVSFHNHSDGNDESLEEIALVAAQRGYKIFGVSDHNRDDKFEGKRVVYFPFYGGVYLVRNMEIRCHKDGHSEGDILVVGHKEHIHPFRPLEDTVEQALEQDAIVIATTPFNTFMGGMGEQQLHKIRDRIHAIEVFNATSNMWPFTYADAEAKAFAQKYGITGIYDEDAHCLSEIGLAGFSVNKNLLRSLDQKPEEIVNLPQTLIGELRRVLTEDGKVINHGYYMPLFSTLFPTKFRTLGHKKAVLKPK